MTEYYIAELANTGTHFKVAKFTGGEQPDNVYYVVLKQKKAKGSLPEMHCDCPNRRRGKHVNDKHGIMVAKWLLAGKPAGHFDDKGVFHGTREIAEPDLIRAIAANEGDQEPGADLPEGDDEDDPV